MLRLQFFTYETQFFSPKILLGVFAERPIDWKMAQSLTNTVVCMMETPERFAMMCRLVDIDRQN